MVETQAPVEDATVLAPGERGGDYVLKITSGLPSGSARFNGYEVSRKGNEYFVAVTNLMPSPDEPIACTDIYGYHEGQFSFEGDLNAGETYTVIINGDLSISFIARGAGGMAMVEKESPIEEIEVMKTDRGFILTVISRLPLGSSCSKFNGYQINRRFAERIEVTVTHMEVGEVNVPCTDDYPAVVTQIPLGGDFDSEKTYTVSVNGTVATFPTVVVPQAGDSASNEDAAAGTPAPIEDATVVVQAPVEGSSISPPETAGGPYILEITSGLPSGCARFSHYYLSQTGNGFSVDVINRMPADETIACSPCSTAL